MKEIAIYGAGGYGREIACLINQINEIKPTWKLIGFFDDDENLSDNKFGKILGGIDALNNWDRPLSIALVIANPGYLEKISSKISNPHIDFPNIIAPNVNVFDIETFSIGKGNIISFGCRISYNVTVGSFNLLNGASTLGHNVEIKNYNVLQPSVRILGDCYVGSLNFFGVNSIVIEGVKIGNSTRLGAMSVAIRNTKDGFSYFGNPARQMKL